MKWISSLQIAHYVIAILFIIIGCGAPQNEPKIDTEQINIDKLKSEQAYSESILTLNYLIGIQNLEAIKLSTINKEGVKQPHSLRMIFSEDQKEKFVIRYNQIGCNTCVDLLFKNKQLINQIAKRYDILVLVDFANYQDYVTWKKTSEIDTGIYWLSTGSLPFDEYFKENSYCFVINSDFLTSKYFFPNNQFPDYVTKYIRDITKS